VKEDDDEVEEDPIPTSGDRLAEDWIPQAEPVEELLFFNTLTGVSSMEHPFRGTMRHVYICIMGPRYLTTRLSHTRLGNRVTPSSAQDSQVP
jgi:hypothetical protein